MIAGGRERGNGSSPTGILSDGQHNSRNRQDDERNPQRTMVVLRHDTGPMYFQTASRS
jgi:hypothetical protein